MKILITGGLGFIGTHLEQALIQRGHDVTVMDRLRINRERYFRGDICDYFRMESIFEQVKPDTVIHLAAMVSRKESEETPYMAIQTNVVGTLNVVQLCLKHKSRIIYAGSSEEYGSAFFGGAIVKEDTPFGEPTSIYSMTKRMAEELIQYYSATKGLVATTLRFFMLYGPGEPPTDYRSALIRFMDAGIHGKPMHVHKGTIRQWCYIDDAIDGIIKVIERKQESSYKTYNFGNDEDISTMDLAIKIRILTGEKSEIITIPVEDTVVPVKLASFKKAKLELWWEATTPLMEGLRRVKMYMDNLQEKELK